MNPKLDLHEYTRSGPGK